MVTQAVVQQAMEELNVPCTSTQLLEYLLQKKRMTYTQWDGKAVISRALSALKKWQVVDRISQGHYKNGEYLWYLTKNPAPEHDSKKCPICINTNKGFNHYMTKMRERSRRNSIRITNATFYNDSNTMGMGHDYS